MTSATIDWRPADCENLAAPATVIPLLQAAIRAAPGSAEPHRKLGNVYLDLFDFKHAAEAFEAAARLAPDDPGTRARLARMWIYDRRYDDVLALLDGAGAPAGIAAEFCMQRGIALSALGRTEDAEAEFRTALATDPRHRRACMRLCRMLRDGGRMAELLATCEDLAARGVSHAQLLLDWGRALAIASRTDDARRLLFDPAKVTRDTIAPPDGFVDSAAFNAALTEELLGNPYRLSEFPSDEEANRGSSRVHHLLCGKRPELVRALLREIQRRVEARIAGLGEIAGANDFDPWRAARPTRAHIRPWGLVQTRDAHESWHTHRGGWLSGVYYVHVPKGLSEEDGRGCIEFGPPPYLARTMPGLIGTGRYAPIAGTLLLAPSHYHHRTIPSERDEVRLSFAFDVVPEDNL